MMIIDMPIQQIEYIPTDDWRQGHTAPILRQAVHAESLGDEGRVAAKEEAVGEACQARDEAEGVGVGDLEGEDLGDKEDEG